MRQFAAHALIAAGVLLLFPSWGQSGVPGPVPAAVKPEPQKDPLGRTTPRGTVFGFLSAARKGDDRTAARYLNTKSRGAEAELLAQRLWSVLDRRLPARLNELNDTPEGSQKDPDHRNEELIGTIESSEGPVDITLQRIDRGKNDVVWLFSAETLIAIPALYEEVNNFSMDIVFPDFLTKAKLLGIPAFQWFMVLVVLPIAYALASLLNRILSASAERVLRNFRWCPELKNPEVIPKPVRLLFLVLVIRWMQSHFSFPLLARQFWSVAATVITIAASVWLLIRISVTIEAYIRRRIWKSPLQGSVPILGLVRWTIDLLIIFVGTLVALEYFGVNVSAALAGLGVGGVAIAFAAQKTLENIIGGISIIFDRAIRVGDFMKAGLICGTVEDIGLRSTRIRTLDRSVVCIPNSQIANESLENLSSRDRFWFHPILSLQYETTAEQMRTVLEGIRTLLLRHALVAPNSIRVQFLRFGASSLDVEVFCYVLSSDYPQFLEVQEELLLRIMDVVQEAGTRIALPAQTTYVATAAALPVVAGREPKATNTSK